MNIELAVKRIKALLPAYGESEHILDYIKTQVRYACEEACVEMPPSGLTQRQYVALAANRILNKAEGMGVSWESL